LRVVKYVPILPALLLCACVDQRAPDRVASGANFAEPRSLDAARGIDLPTDGSDFLNELKSSRLDFVARYYRDPASHWPTLSGREVQRLSSLGLNIVAVWESHSHNPAHMSYADGYYDAVSAYGQAKAAGQPAGSAIYFAIDFDARNEALASVDQYFRGVGAGFAAASGGRPRYKVGVYGSGAVCAAVKQAGLARYAWLSNSTAWSGSLAYEGWDIRQGGRLAELSFNHDADEARKEYGSFRVTDVQVAAPYEALRQQSQRD